MQANAIKNNRKTLFGYMERESVVPRSYLVALHANEFGFDLIWEKARALNTEIPIQILQNHTWAIAYNLIKIHKNLWDLAKKEIPSVACKENPATARNYS